MFSESDRNLLSQACGFESRPRAEVRYREARETCPRGARGGKADIGKRMARQRHTTERLKETTAETSGSESISTKLRRTARLAKEDPTRIITSLSHHLDEELLREAYRLTRKDGAAELCGLI